MSAVGFAVAPSPSRSHEGDALPLWAPASPERAIAPSRLSDPSRLSAPAPPITAIVDDDPSVRRALQRMVEAGGYTAQAFATAREFLDALPRYRVACLVLDIYLGETSGFDLLEQLRADGMRIPVILITAHDDAPTRERIDRSAVAGHLLKPFDGPALLDAIQRAIGRG